MSDATAEPAARTRAAAPNTKCLMLSLLKVLSGGARAPPGVLLSSTLVLKTLTGSSFPRGLSRHLCSSARNPEVLGARRWNGHGLAPARPSDRSGGGRGAQSPQVYFAGAAIGGGAGVWAAPSESLRRCMPA